MLSVGFVAAPSKRQSRWSSSLADAIFCAHGLAVTRVRPARQKKRDGEREAVVHICWRERKGKRREKEEEWNGRVKRRARKRATGRSMVLSSIKKRHRLGRQAAVVRSHRGRRIKSKNKIIGKRRNSASAGCSFGGSKPVDINGHVHQADRPSGAPLPLGCLLAHAEPDGRLLIALCETWIPLSACGPCRFRFCKENACLVGERQVRKLLARVFFMLIRRYRGWECSYSTVASKIWNITALYRKLRNQRVRPFLDFQLSRWLMHVCIPETFIQVKRAGTFTKRWRKSATHRTIIS